MNIFPINKFQGLSLFILSLCTPAVAFAATQAVHEPMDLTNSGLGFTAIAIFVFAYLLVMGEEFMHLRKSKPVMIAAGLIWGMIGWYYTQHGMAELAENAVRHNLLEYAELMLFLLVAMTYVNAMEERLVFDALRSWLINKGFGFRQLFWLTGILAFFISPKPGLHCAKPVPDERTESIVHPSSPIIAINAESASAASGNSSTMT